MGLLVNGMWRDQWYDTKGDGKFKRKDAAFRDWLTADGSPGPDGQRGFKAEPGRYHLYVSLACPWAHRVLIVRALKGIGDDLLPVSVVHWSMRENGWEFLGEEMGRDEQLVGDLPSSDLPAPDLPRGDMRATNDPVNGYRYAHQLYTHTMPDYTGRVTIPILWDKREGTIVSNESSEIIRMLDTAFDDLGADGTVRLSPPDLMDEIRQVNGPIYEDVNNGVYKSGFATKQEAYDEAVTALFERLDALEERLSEQRWLVGDTMTEADIRLFTTLVRFDAVYHGHFKCNIRRVADYPNLSNYVRDIYQMEAVRPTVNFEHIKNHYYHSHETVNPTRIIPRGPALDMDAPHDRGRFEAEAGPMRVAA